ncbi:universal stress protein [Salinibacter sp.]|uniref:universal stress protein n=1 Tax=Salinibacter sp. TaxID=2065818 RepID=UPI0021E72878|nr:universal stress protein [Salinibacter sp.]
MTDPPCGPSSILVNLELPDPAPLSPTLIDALSSLRVVLLGWLAVPEQTSPAQARDQFGVEAEETLDTAARRFEDAGAEVTTRLVFTGDKLDTLTRVSTEENCDAVLIPGTMDAPRRVLVPLRGLENIHRTAPFVADLCRESTATVTLLHVVDDEETEASARDAVLKPAADRMREYGLDTTLLELNALEVDASPSDAIVDRASAYDLVVLGETKPSVQDVLFGTVPERIVKTTDVPIVVVRHRGKNADVAEQLL